MDNKIVVLFIFMSKNKILYNNIKTNTTMSGERTFDWSTQESASNGDYDQRDKRQYNRRSTSASSARKRQQRVKQRSQNRSNQGNRSNRSNRSRSRSSQGNLSNRSGRSNESNRGYNNERDTNTDRAYEYNSRRNVFYHTE
jgi:hypothetical protein